MKNYEVSIRHKNKYTIEIEASSESEAIRLAKKQVKLKHPEFNIVSVTIDKIK